MTGARPDDDPRGPPRLAPPHPGVPCRCRPGREGGPAHPLVRRAAARRRGGRPQRRHRLRRDPRPCCSASPSRRRSPLRRVVALVDPHRRARRHRPAQPRPTRPDGSPPRSAPRCGRCPSARPSTPATLALEKGSGLAFDDWCRGPAAERPAHARALRRGRAAAGARPPTGRGRHHQPRRGRLPRVLRQGVRRHGRPATRSRTCTSPRSGRWPATSACRPRSSTPSPAATSGTGAPMPR